MLLQGGDLGLLLEQLGVTGLQLAVELRVGLAERAQLFLQVGLVLIRLLEGGL